MRSENTGKKIASIKIFKSKVVVKFQNKDKLEIPYDIYITHYFYVGKVLSDKEYLEINDEIAVYDLYKYAKKIATTRLYTEWKMREKLYQKEANKDQVDLVIKKLKEAHLIDDKAYYEEYIHYASEKGYGKNKIIAKLKDKGVFKENIDIDDFPIEEEIKKAKKWLPSLERKYSKYSSSKKKEKATIFLVNQGFDLDVARKVAGELKDNNAKKEKENIQKDYDKLLHQYSRKYEGRELKDKIYQSLRSKGYKNNDIYQIMEENNL